MQTQKPPGSGSVRNGTKRTWGFRCSPIDAAALIALLAITAGLHQISRWWWLVAIVAVHFFLFRNVFRLLWLRALIGTAFFASHVSLWFLVGRLNWFNVLACQLPVSVLLIVWEIKAPRYHGMLARRLNPALDACLEGRLK